MPELLGLLLEDLDQMRMGVAERVDGDAGGEVEIALSASPSRATHPRLARNEASRANSCRKAESTGAVSVMPSETSSNGLREPPEGTGRRTRRTKSKSRPRGGSDPVISGLACQLSILPARRPAAVRGDASARVRRSRPGNDGKLGKTEKTNSRAAGNSCHGVNAYCIFEAVNS